MQGYIFLGVRCHSFRLNDEEVKADDVDPLVGCDGLFCCLCNISRSTNAYIPTFD